MKFQIKYILIFFLFTILTGCLPAEVDQVDEPVDPATVFVPPPEGYDTEDLLVCTIYFYSGTNIGDRSLTTGPQSSTDNGQTWTHMAWENLITNAIEVGPYGKMVYCSCGNGVLASTDGGRNWRISGGWQMAEIQDVKIGPESPLVVWAAGAYGLYLSEDGAITWTRPGDPQPFRYTQTIQPDRDDPDHVLVGTEIGLYISDDRGQSYEQRGPESPVRTILQDSRDANTFWVGTDGAGLWKSVDSGETWHPILNSSEIINRVIQHPDNPDWLYCGIGHGVSFSKDNGGTWTEVTNGFGEFSPVYALLIDDGNPDLIYAGARDGFYVSENGGSSWGTITADDGEPVLYNAVIFDLWQGELYRGDEEPGSTEPGTLNVNSDEPDGEEYRSVTIPGFDDRSWAAGGIMAGKSADRLAGLEEGRHMDPFSSIALVREGHASEELWDDLRARFTDFGHSMFDSFPAMSFYLHCEEEIPDDLKEIIRAGLVSNNIYRGDTENHWLMYYTALLLTAQEWPETSEGEWYTGRSTQENYDDAIGWINEWTRITTTIGQGEFDSPHYFSTYMSPCLLLYEFVQDPILKRQMGMVIDLLLADMAAESLYGRYCGGHSRMYDPTVVRGDYDNSASYYYLYFGTIDFPERFHSWALNGIYGSYVCPAPIAEIALNRDEPYVHTEVKRVRNQMRYSELLNSPVYKYDYMTPDYCLGSLHGGILQPIQQHTWDVTWIGSAPNTTLFSLHPYYSSYELAMFFPEDPHMLTASVQAQKSTYTDPQKLNSSSPYERVFQYEDSLIVSYNIPEGTNHPHVTLYVPDCINHTEENGWIIGQDGNTYIAVYPCTDGEWYDEPNEDFPPAQRLQIPAGQTALVVEIGREEIDGSFDDFKNAMMGRLPPDFVETDGGPIVRYINRHGHALAYYWPEDKRELDGVVWDYPTDMLFDGPGIQGAVNERIISIYGENAVRTLDFNDLTITNATN